MDWIQQAKSEAAFDFGEKFVFAAALSVFIKGRESVSGFSAFVSIISYAVLSNFNFFTSSSGFDERFRSKSESVESGS